MDLVALLFIAASFTGIVFLIGRLTCPRRDRVPLTEVDGVILWTTLCRGWLALSAIAPLTLIIDDRPDNAAA
ncbi:MULTISPECIES: hypothetical protein [unclassified Brevibacterium]|uniref:hypothetical protein n=1 Tax=unclassified Brevibacterium TaxID=2614124 RepID=UPI001BA9F38A|nr:hypothetical protein [Brevibacterium sp. W7.2]